jgi:hypothetical protein
MDLRQRSVETVVEDDGDYGWMILLAVGFIPRETKRERWGFCLRIHRSRSHYSKAVRGWWNPGTVEVIIILWKSVMASHLHVLAHASSSAFIEYKCFLIK